MYLKNARAIVTYLFATLGILVILLVNIGVVADVRAFDRTSGGYEPPFTEYSGEPINWDKTFLTPSGMYTPGFVLDTHVDCTTGMINFEVFGLSFDYRELSDRALAVHHPREPCEERGFSAEF